VERAVGQYRFLERIGEGGLGEVYRARDTRLGRTVVVKCVPREISRSAGARARLLTAAATLTSLSHPHVAELYELAEDGEDLFLVFEHVQGETLAQLLGGQPLNPRRATEVAAQIADALAHAHSTGVLHLDLRPDTIMVTRKGQAKVLDLGLSDFTRSGTRRRQVAAGQLNPEGAAARFLSYVSPEQALGEDEDARSDTFSLGAILYEMLTGEAPFHQPDATNTVLSVLRTTPPMPSERNPAVPRYYDAVVGRMLAKTMHGRYETTKAAAAALHSLAGRPEPARTSASQLRARRWPMVAGVGAAAALAVALIWWLRSAL
jgi:eukaryotic-like serine/threonine-protein kinase